MNAGPARALEPFVDASPAGHPASAQSTDWHILTGEYPPQPGGVADYTRLVAQGLADAGDRVTVWAPACDGQDEACAGVTVRRLPDHFGSRSLARLGRELDRASGSRRLLVQYVPHAFGWRAMNVPFCLWLRSRRRDHVWVMFHEVAFPSGRQYSVAQNALGLVTRWMASIVGRSAERVFISIPAWQPVLQTLVGAGLRTTWLPVPSTIRQVADPAGVAAIRSRIAGRHHLVGHVGGYGSFLRPLLDASLPALLASTDCRLLLLGRGGDAYRSDLISRHPSFADRVHAPGELTESDLSRHVSACDVMLQPYPEGITSRHTSAMLALSHGRPAVTTVGHLSDPMWASSGAIAAVPAATPDALAPAVSDLLGDPARQRELAARARTLYADLFDVSRTVITLRSTDPACES